MGAGLNVMAEQQQQSDCPIQGGGGGEVDPRNMMPPANQLPAPDQPFPLPTNRQKSSIPRAGTQDNWQYPSQQMFYNALRRKGWEFGPGDLEAEDMDHIIKIHNANNESAWQEVSQVTIAQTEISPGSLR